ncbi:MAG: hypothetical protein CM1200mP26_29990 [Acidimicrobiales bacterium]|nr:MAG: hypothetical protein CM1200mP26_29990 [Acidimicrobiales bacterium]
MAVEGSLGLSSSPTCVQDEKRVLTSNAAGTRRFFVSGPFNKPLVATVAAVAVLEPMLYAVDRFREFCSDLCVLALCDECPRLAIVDNLFQLRRGQPPVHGLRN